MITDDSFLYKKVTCEYMSQTHFTFCFVCHCMLVRELKVFWVFGVCLVFWGFFRLFGCCCFFCVLLLAIRTGIDRRMEGGGGWFRFDLEEQSFQFLTC